MDKINEYIYSLESGHVDLGPLIISFYWENSFNEIGNVLKRWLNLKSKINTVDMKQKKPYVKFIIGTSMWNEMLGLSSPQQIISTWAWDSASIYTADKNLLCICKPRLTFKKRILRALPQILIRFANPLFASYWELQAGYLLYNNILRVIHGELLRHHVTLVHGAGLSDFSDKAVLVSGGGGIGKTTTAAYFLSTGVWRLIGDDFVLVSEAGEIYDSHLPAHLYSYHVPILEYLGMRELWTNWLDWIHWKIYSILRKTGSLRRVVLPNKNEQGKIKICCVVDVIPDKSREVIVESISPIEAAHAIAQYTYAELKILDVSNQLESVILILSKALSSVTCYRIIISENDKGISLAKRIFKLVTESTI